MYLAHVVSVFVPYWHGHLQFPVTPGHEHAENAGRLQRLHYVERNSSCCLNLGPTRDDVGRQFANAFEHTFVLICHGASLRPYGFAQASMPENKVTVVARSTAAAGTLKPCVIRFM